MTDGLMARRKRLGVVLILLSGLSLLCAFPIQAVAVAPAVKTTVTLKKAVAIDADAVRLSDIADIGGTVPLPFSGLGKTMIGKAPLPGHTRFIDQNYIRIRLRQAGFETERIIFRGPEDVRVTRTSAQLPVALIREAVERSIRDHMPWPNESVTVKQIEFDESLGVPTGRLSYRIVPGRGEDYLGQTMLALHLFVDGEPYRKIWVNATISVMSDVVVVTRPLGRRQPVETADVALEKRDLADLPADAIRKIDDVLGNRTTRMLHPGTVLQAGMVTLPPLVRRGDIVKIVARKGPMTITATGMVKQQGAKGDMVRVVNTDSRRMITARVTGPGAVTVEF